MTRRCVVCWSCARVCEIEGCFRGAVRSDIGWPTGWARESEAERARRGRRWAGQASLDSYHSYVLSLWQTQSVVVGSDLRQIQCRRPTGRLHQANLRLRGRRALRRSLASTRPSRFQRAALLHHLSSSSWSALRGLATTPALFGTAWWNASGPKTFAKLGIPCVSIRHRGAFPCPPPVALLFALLAAYYFVAPLAQQMISVCLVLGAVWHALAFGAASHDEMMDDVALAQMDS